MTTDKLAAYLDLDMRFRAAGSASPSSRAPIIGGVISRRVAHHPQAGVSVASDTA
jgi:hypothetical protein